MNTKEFNELRDGIFSRCIELTQKKGEDYTKGNNDVLINFKEGEFLGISPEKTLAVYMKKHIDAIFNHIKTGGQSESEPISERITDAINYLIFLQALIVDKTGTIPENFLKFMNNEESLSLPKIIDESEDIGTDVDIIIEESDIDTDIIDNSIIKEHIDKKLSSLDLKTIVIDSRNNRLKWLDNHVILVTEPNSNGEIYQAQTNLTETDLMTLYIYKISKTKQPIESIDFRDIDYKLITTEMIMNEFESFINKHVKEKMI